MIKTSNTERVKVGWVGSGRAGPLAVTEGIDSGWRDGGPFPPRKLSAVICAFSSSDWYFEVDCSTLLRPNPRPKYQFIVRGTAIIG